jgi:hypothetical protein
MKKKKTNQQRYPRPLGLTSTCHQYNQDKTTQNKQKVIKHILRAYINKQMTYNDKPISLSDLAIITDTPEQILYRELCRQVQQYSGILGDGEEALNYLRGLNFYALKTILEDKAQCLNQLQILASSQDGTYKPFISGAVNQALSISLQATKNLTDILKNMAPSPAQTQILIQNQQAQSLNQKGIGINEAMEIIQAQKINTLEYSEEPYQALPIKAEFGTLPEVRANYQQGTQDAQLSEISNLQGKLKTKHQDRRADQLDLDTENDI